VGLFHQTFGSTPTIRARAPGRVNLIGGHVDYLGGPVLPIAINRFVEVSGAPKEQGEGVSASCEVGSKFGGELLRGSFDPVRPEREAAPTSSWLNYVIGVVAGYVERGIEVPPFELAIEASLPVGAGLSSSAALETAVAHFVEQLTGERLEVVERAKLCRRAEHVFAGVPCGLLDQLAVGASRADQALWIDCRDLSLEWIPFPPELVVMVANTGVKHKLGDSEYKKRVDTCARACAELGLASLRDLSVAELEQRATAVPFAGLDELAFRRVRHAVTEMARVEAFADVLQKEQGKLPGLAALRPILHASHMSLRDDYEVSCRELDLLVDAANRFPGDGFFGVRMTGGGFGGCTINLLRADVVEPFAAHLDAAFGGGLNWFQTSACDGAELCGPPS